ncbi:MAG: glycosyltransferase family 2 protein [Candidatus Aminicenantes bacterium]|nr:glycosyltransferase family 2 protein [Candidatus Aminicenantes bacterium]
MWDLSIIVVNWNSRQFIRACLNSIYSLPHDLTFECIVVDNHSSDGSCKIISKEFPAVQLIENPANLGFAAANNQGARAAAARFLLFLNPDTLIHPGTLDGAVAFMEQHPDAGIMGCRTVHPDGTLQATAFTFPSKLRMFAYVSGLNRFFKLSRFRNHSVRRTPDYVQGSFLIISKDLFDDSGGFDERFFLYAEEVDLCMRVKAAGFTIYYNPAVSITHHGGGSGGNSFAALGHYIRSSISLYQHYRRPREAQRLRQVMRVALRGRVFLGLVFSSLNLGAKKMDFECLWHDLSAENNQNTLEK